MANEGQPFLVQAIFPFKGKNNDELCFKKGDIITVTQFEEGGWWEGTLGEKTGWFPTNYVKEYKVHSDCLSPSKTSENIISQQRIYREVVLKDFVEAEKNHVQELQNLSATYLQPLEKAEILTREEYRQMVGNMRDVISIHEGLLARLESVHLRAPGEQRVGNLFLTVAPKLKQVHHTYCSGHPKAVAIINKHKQELINFCEGVGGSLITLTAGLSKPFRRVDKYSCHLQEVERHLEENHPDRGDTQRALSVYKDIAAACSVVRRQKELELEVVTGGVRGWEGQDMSRLGEIIHMGSVAVGPEHRDRYLVLFPSTLLMLSVSSRMSAFIYEGKLPLTGIKVSKLDDSDLYKNAFEIVGPLIDPIIAVCQSKEDQQKWVTLITEQCNVIGVKASPLTLTSRKSRNEIDDVPLDSAWSVCHLRPSPPSRCFVLRRDKDKASKNAEKQNFEEDAQVLRVIEAYCASSNSRYVSSDILEDLEVLKSEKDRTNADPSRERSEDTQRKMVETVFGLEEKVTSLQQKISSLTQNILEEKTAREQLQTLVQSYFKLSNKANDLLIKAD